MVLVVKFCCTIVHHYRVERKENKLKTKAKEEEEKKRQKEREERRAQRERMREAEDSYWKWLENKVSSICLDCNRWEDTTSHSSVHPLEVRHAC